MAELDSWQIRSHGAHQSPFSHQLIPIGLTSVWNLLQLAVSLCVFSTSLPLTVPVSVPAAIPQDIELKQQHHWGNSEFNFTAKYVTGSLARGCPTPEIYGGPQGTVGEAGLSCSLCFGTL